jgi:hypothetical protein
VKRVLALLSVLALVAGCAPRPAGTDGSLVNGWPMMDRATYAVPQVGHCYNGNELSYGSTDYTGYQDVPCGDDHTVEVAAHGTFTGAAASASSPPVVGDATRKAARTTCAAAAGVYLGGNWETAFVYLRVGLPSLDEWTGGDRTYTCELGPDAAPNDYHLKGSVKGGLTGSRVAARACVELSSPDQPNKDGYYDNPDGINSVPCTSAHNGEFGGVFDAPDGPLPDSKDDKLMSTFEIHCGLLLAKYLGQSFTQLDKRTDLTYYWFWPSEESWTHGERAVDCYLATQVAHPVTKSLKAP